MCRHQRAHHVLECHRRVGFQRGEREELAALHLLHDGHPHTVLRAEVVAEHPVAGPQLGGQPPKREVRQTMLGDIGDRRIEEFLTDVGLGHQKSVPLGS